MNSLTEIIESGFLGKRILVVGDIVADQFLRGSISRVSREAPVFILRHEDTETMGGGAANAAVNVSALGGVVNLVGMAGADPVGRELFATLAGRNVRTEDCVTGDSIRTTTKLRVLAGQQYARRQQVIRIDYENEDGIDAGLLKRIEDNSIALLKETDAVIISDYGYGVASIEIGRKIITEAGELGIPVVVDSRSRLEDFRGATAATPNKEEVERLLGGPFSTEAAIRLREKLGLKALLVTLGNKGMFLALEDGENELIDIVGKDEPVDVTGAGDTVIAAYALGIASGLGFSTAAHVANHAGGIVVMKNATASASHKELLDSIRTHEPQLTELVSYRAG